MPPKTVIGILTPQTGGFYYGAVLDGILEAASARSAAVVAFDTARLRLADSGDDPLLASAHICGWLAVNAFDDSELMARLARSGQPVVSVHAAASEPDGCAVLPDNEGGVRALTRHLLEHGHTRIGFAGNPAQTEMRERLAGYQAALAEHGIEHDPSLLLRSFSDDESAGERIAERLLLAEDEVGAFPCTALIAATDRMALGLMARLIRAGKRLPRDLAVVGFDDIQGAQFAEPPLTTVHQDFRAVAASATELLLNRLLLGEPLPAQVRVPARMVLRRSCGCTAAHTLLPPVRRGEPDRAAMLMSELLRQASGRSGRDVGVADWPGAELIARGLHAAVEGVVPLEQPILAWWLPYLDFQRDAESLVRMMNLLETTARAWCPELEFNPRITTFLRDLRVTLLHAWQRSERVLVAQYESVSEAGYRITAALGNPHNDPLRDLSWLQWGLAQLGCCALWRPHAKYAAEEEEAPKQLELVGQFTREGSPVVSAHATMFSPEAFPPRAFVDAAHDTNTMLTVASIRGGDGCEYGLFALCYPLDSELLDHMGSPGDWGTQLGAAVDRARADEQLRRNAERDALTGLANRFTLLRALEHVRHGAERGGTFALLFIDLDDFKKVNDSLGHEAGDELLINVATRLRAVVETRGPDAPALVARLGGDEFVVVLPRIAGEAEATELADRIQQVLQEPCNIGGHRVFLSGSVGISLGRGSERSAQELLRDADTAMYRAKVQGRARYEVFHHGMHQQAVEKLQLDARLRQALAEDELELWYQPVLSLSHGRVCGAEALIRWRHPEQGLMGPGRFLAVAHDVGLSIPISQWTIRRACVQAAEWQTPGLPPVPVHVNIPPEHVQQPDFVDFVEAVLAETGLNPSAFGIEILESTLIEEPELCARSLARLLSLGVHVAIDDFGTGYSSLSYLRDFPATVLKIDQSFVRGLADGAPDRALVKAIITMGQGLGLMVVAEGIETARQLQCLVQLGCDQGQGFFFARPMDARTASEHLLATRVPAEYLPVPSSRAGPLSSLGPRV